MMGCLFISVLPHAYLIDRNINIWGVNERKRRKRRELSIIFQLLGLKRYSKSSLEELRLQMSVRNSHVWHLSFLFITCIILKWVGRAQGLCSICTKLNENESKRTRSREGKVYLRWLIYSSSWIAILKERDRFSFFSGICPVLTLGLSEDAQSNAICSDSQTVERSLWYLCWTLKRHERCNY